MRKKRGHESGKRHVHRDENKEVIFLFLRYLILIVVAIPNLFLFYAVFTPLTAYPATWLLGLSYGVSLIGSSIILINRSVPIELIGACIAGAAYYLLMILNLTTPNIKLGKRLTMLLSAFAVFLIVNIMRIYVLSRMAVEGSNFFDITHLFFWYSISTVLVVLIWFVEVKLFKIEGIPFYSDLKFLYKNRK